LLVSRALLLLAGEWTDANLVRWIDPARILAQAWHTGRLADCRERLAAGEQAPAISVVGFRIGRSAVLYDVADGMHRTIAHREAGQKIKARISGYHRIEPSRYVLWQDHLWRQEKTGLHRADLEPVPKDLRHVLRVLGVQDRNGSHCRENTNE
jgi:uncharacterized ParB-like nuclease family protein